MVCIVLWNGYRNEYRTQQLKNVVTQGGFPADEQKNHCSTAYITLGNVWIINQYQISECGTIIATVKLARHDQLGRRRPG